MTGILHPSTMAAVARQRRADLLAEADRDRLAHRAAGAGGVDRPRWADLTLGVWVALAMALPVLASLSG